LNSKVKPPAASEKGDIGSAVNTATASAYGYSRTVDLPFPNAVARAREALQTEGFGVLCEIDIKEKLREKLGVDFEDYVILGACNPPLAHRALQQERALGLLLPCNVVVYRENNRTVVSAIDAARMLSIVGNTGLEEIATEVNRRLRSVIDGM
jgi:uncharacterized protein (DUF302 family)